MAFRPDMVTVSRKDWGGFEITEPMQEAAYEHRANPSALWSLARASGYVRECLRLRAARLASSSTGIRTGATSPDEQA